MDVLAKIGARICVSPGEDLSFILSENEYGMTRDRSSFELRVGGILRHGDRVYGVYGPIISGPEQYRGLICSLLVRTFPAQDWRHTSKDQANFKIGPSVVTMDPTVSQDELGGLEFFYHPDGTKIDGYPRFSRFGDAKVVEDDLPAEPVIRVE